MKSLPHYMLVVCPVNIIVRVPGAKTLRGPRWRKVMSALTHVMRAYDLRQKDIHQLEGMLPLYEDENEEDTILRGKLDSAFGEFCVGNLSHFRHFNLYDWDVKTERFKLTRKALPD